ncbi:MAG: transcriptional repressor [Anaerolineae bacterium]|nr:transcriptional repressor [Anaerolineae bacterium]
MPSVHHILSRLESHGERLTIQRRSVIEALAAHEDHQTIQDIQISLQQSQGVKLSETTIYRILEWLKRLTLVSQTDMGSAGIVYCLVDTPRHHHLICLDCGAITDIDDSYFANLRRKLKDDLGFVTRIDHMAIYGQCADCAAKANANID